MSTVSPSQGPKDQPLREVALVLRAQWRAFVASGATVFRWVLAPDEPGWVHTFLASPMDGTTKALVLEAPFERAEGHGFALGNAALAALGAVRVAGTAPWACPPVLPRGHDVDVFVDLVASFARHHAGTWMQHVALVLAPAHVGDARAWLRWVESLAVAVVHRDVPVRLVLLDDAARTQYGALAQSLGGRAHTTHAHLAIGERVLAMTEAAADPSRLEGQLRVLTVRAMLAVSAGRLDEAARLANTLEALATEAGTHAAAVPVRFALGGGLTGAGRHADAVDAYRAAEHAAERAEAASDLNGLQLRVMARFGVGAALLATPHGAAAAAACYQGTVPLCQKLRDTRLELEAHRTASLAHERAGALWPAWDAARRALECVARLSDAERPNAMLTPLADALLRLAATPELRSHRESMDAELRRLGLRRSAHA